MTPRPEHTMKTRLALRSILGALALVASLALPGDLRAASPAETICGIWEYSQEQGPQRMLGYSIFEADGTGSMVGRMTMRGQTLWIVALTTWKIEDDKLTQTITARTCHDETGSSTTETTSRSTKPPTSTARARNRKKRVTAPVEFERSWRVPAM
jgi:hypothetical protein